MNQEVSETLKEESKELFEAKEAAETKAAELSTQKGAKVYALVFNTPEGIVVGYVQQPNRNTKLAVFDAMLQGPSAGGELILNTCLLKEESHPRLTTDDDIFTSACIECFSLFKIYPNELKKK